MASTKLPTITWVVLRRSNALGAPIRVGEASPLRVATGGDANWCSSRRRRRSLAHTNPRRGGTFLQTRPEDWRKLDLTNHIPVHSRSNHLSSYVQSVGNGRQLMSNTFKLLRRRDCDISPGHRWKATIRRTTPNSRRGSESLETHTPGYPSSTRRVMKEKRNLMNR